MGAPEFRHQSERYADGGDARMAQLAAWAADVHTLEDLLWEHGLGAAPDPLGELANVGELVATAIDAAAAGLADGTYSIRRVVEIAREAMICTFDASVHDLLEERLGPLAHLDVLAERTGVPGRTVERLAGRKPGELVEELQVAADDCTAMATLLTAGGEADAAARLARQADAAAFEAFLLLAALRSGDHTFASVDLRWDLATSQALASGSAEREQLVGAVGTTEHERLRAALGPAAS